MANRRPVRKGKARKPPQRPSLRLPPDLTALRAPSHLSHPSRIADLLAARRRAFDALQIGMVDSFAPQSDRPARHPAMELPPGDRAHAVWVLDNRPPRNVHYIGETGFFARQYRRDFARFGGPRPYIDNAGRAKLEADLCVQLLPKVMQAAGLSIDDQPAFVQRRMQAMLDEATPEDLARLNDLLLKEVWLVADVLPLDPPPKPAGWSAPDAGAYAPPAAALLERGPDPDDRWAAAAARNRVWKEPGAQDMLIRLATDPGLLQGWPAEAATWAPYHALSLLGALKAHRAAAAVLRVVDLVKRDDWISDHLFLGCLAAMGPEVEPLLWDVVNDRKRDPEIRGLGILALAALARRHPARTAAIATALMVFMLQRPLLDRKRKIVNALAAMVLDDSPFEGAVSRAAILEADAAGRLDHKYFNPTEMAQHGLGTWGPG